MDSRQAVRWHGMIDAHALQREALRRILDAAARAIQARGRFQIVLSGGQTPRALYRMLRSQPVDWSAWHVYLGDERGAPREDPERNSHMVAEEWLGHVPIPEGHFFVYADEQKRVLWSTRKTSRMVPHE